jgi:hypothetical protein
MSTQAKRKEFKLKKDLLDAQDQADQLQQDAKSFELLIK